MSWKDELDLDLLDTATLRILEKLYERKPEWQEEMASLYTQGASDTEVMCALHLTYGSFRHLYNDMTGSNFKEMVDMGRLYSQAFWERAGRTNIGNKNFNTSLYNINMQNRFGWAAKSEESKTNFDMTGLDESEIESALRQMQKTLQAKNDS